MAIVAFDRFETTLAAALSDTDTEMTIPDADVARLTSLAQLGADVWGSATQRLLRVPMYLDDGVHVERILLPLPAVEAGPSPIVRGADRFAFAVGTPLRCSPSAEHVMQGHAGIQDLDSVTQALVVPGELVAVGNVGSAPFVLQFPDSGSSSREHIGETWPAEVLLAINTVDAVTVSFKRYDLSADASVLLKGVAGLSSSVEIPAGTAFALFKIRRLPLGLPPYGIRGYYGWLVELETWA